ncbi:MAG: hypothetical protein Q9209_004626 [Squamulea sp. 1 TL-2023]
MSTLSNGHTHHDGTQSSSSSASTTTSETHQRSPAPGKNKFEKLAGKTKKVTKRLLGPGDQHDQYWDLELMRDPATRVLKHDPAFNPNQLDSRHHSEKSLAANVRFNLQTVATAILHPKEGAKGKAARSTAGRLSKIERPIITKDMDMQFLEAHDNPSRAQSVASSDKILPEQDPESSKGDCKDKFKQLEAQRESLRAAHTLSRHVHRVRVVPKRRLDFPVEEFFLAPNDRGHNAGYDWLKWLGYNLLYYTQDFSAQYIDDFDKLPFDVESLQLQFERLISASAPWQATTVTHLRLSEIAFFMDMRSVYRWENPKNTIQWLGIYGCLWYTQHLMGFVYGYVIYVVVKNRYFPSSVEALRASMHRVDDQRSKAYKFGELVDKHGRKHWLQPLLNDLGPFVQLQLNDIANMLEVFANFHAWIYPRKTGATLIFLAVCFLITVLTDMAFCMKIASFIIGGTFFFCWPIASRYPKYRYLVSPLKWVLWDIPTDAEWSFQYLRRNAQKTREKLIERVADRVYRFGKGDSRASCCYVLSQEVPNINVDSVGPDEDEDWHSTNSSTGILDGFDIVSYRAFLQGVVGRLFIYSGGIRFVRSFKRKELWRRSFLELVEMRKQDGSALSKIPAVSSQSLELKFIDNSRVSLEGMQERDAAFSSIIGLSALQWQSLQAKTIPADSSFSL